MKKQLFIIVTKYFVYVIIFILLYIFQNNTVSILQIYGVKPILLLPAAIALSMVEGEFVGSLFGAFAGLLCDFASFSLYGFNAILALVFCAITGLLVIYLVKPNWINCLLITGIFMFIRGGLDFFFSYGLWGYEGWDIIFLTKTIPIILYSSIISPLFLLLFKKLHGYFEIV